MSRADPAPERLSNRDGRRNPEPRIRELGEDGEMKIVSYAGQQLVTTDDVADSLVTLAAAVAKEGEADAVEIPILVGGREDCADLVIGVGNDLLVGPHEFDDDEPDFTEHAARLQAHRLYPDSPDVDDDSEPDWHVDVDLDLDNSSSLPH